MKLNDWHEKVVLITGGTQGIGLATGLAYGALGARAVLTYRWGSADLDAVRARFEEVGAPAPLIMEADVARDEDTEALMAQIAAEHGGVDVLVSNVCVVQRGQGIAAHRRRTLLRSLEYSSWPLVAYLEHIERQFGRYPGYAVAMSSDGPDSSYPGYDYVAISKAALETLVRYLAVTLAPQGVRVNALRTRQVLTTGYREVFGAAGEFLDQRFPEYSIAPEEVGAATVALTSGLMDGMSGQVLTMDRGARLVDNLITLGPRLEGLENAW